MAVAKKQGKGLVTYVHVAGTIYGPGDKVPDDVAKRITNPAAWGESSDSDDNADDATA